MKYGMLAFLGAEVTAEDMLVRWEKEIGVVEDRAASLVWLREFIVGVSRLKIGNVVEIRYPRGGYPELHKVREAPPAAHVTELPQ